MKTHASSKGLSAVDAVLLLANVRGLNVKPFLTKTSFTRLRKRIYKTYGVDFAGPPDLFAHELLVFRGGDFQLWPDNRKFKADHHLWPRPPLTRSDLL